MKKNILVNINRGYVKHFLAMINSLAINNQDSEFDVYVMHTDLQPEDKANILTNVRANINLIYIFMDKSLFKGAPKVKRYPYEIYYRIFAPINNYRFYLTRSRQNFGTNVVPVLV